VFILAVTIVTPWMPDMISFHSFYVSDFFFHFTSVIFFLFLDAGHDFFPFILHQ